MRQPFPHQEKAVVMLREALRAGKKRPVLMLGCGAGKTKIASDIFHMARAKGKRCLFVADQITLIDQTIEAFFAEGHREIGAIQGDHPMTDFSRPLQVASIQTLARRTPPAFDIAIFDECFVEGAQVSTPQGNKCIENINKGDIVHNAIGVGRVQAVMRKRVEEIWTVRFSDGTTIEATGDHPFFTRGGWAPLNSLEGKSVCSRKGLRRLWGTDETDVAQAGKGVVSHFRGDMEEEEFLRVILRAEILESDVKSGDAQEAIGNSAQNWSQANAAGREWKASNRSAGSPSGKVGGRMVGRACSKDGDFSQARDAIPDMLQGGHSESRDDDSDRGGWDEPQGKTATFGCEERRFSHWKRVESVACEKLASPRTVFNLHISGHPSYFVENVLVHNCHEFHKAHGHIIEDNPDKPIIGLSATPFMRGMGNIFDCLIIPATDQELIDAGRQLPLVAYAPYSPDLANVKIKAGEYDEGALSIDMRDNRLVADIVETWKQLGENRPTVGYGVDKAHAQMMCDRFNAAGIPFGYIDGDTSKADRDKMKVLVESRQMAGVWSVGTMIKGVDWKISCGIDAQPTRSHKRHKQKCGRVVRTTTGEEHGLWLDHAGNCLRLGMPVDIIRTELCTKAKGEKSEPEAMTTKPTSLCPKCKAVKTAKVCVCGYESKRETDLTEGAGQLARIGGDKAGPKKAEPTPEERSRFHAELAWYAQTKGKAPGYATAIYKAKYGKFPEQRYVKPIPASPETLSYIKARNIRWAKGQQRRHA